VYLSYGVSQTVPFDMQYILFVIREVLVGLVLGYTATLFFAVVNTAAGFIDMQIGFGIANVIDPLSGQSAPIMGGFKYAVAVLLFLTMNGHHHMLNAIFTSYEWVPLSNSLFNHIYEGSISTFLLTTFTNTFVLAFQLAAPIVVALFLTDVGLGFLARTAPQFNVFVIGIPLKIIVGLAILLIVIPGLAYLFQQLFATMFSSMDELLKIIQRSGAAT
jgi:flagellar biosynthetic protein FliR